VTKDYEWLDRYLDMGRAVRQYGIPFQKDMERPGAHLKEKK